jgi:predicted amidohydrolase YtcJ
MLSLGITSVQDATRSNSPERWDTLSRLKANGSFGPRITMMAGSDHLDQFLNRGLRSDTGDLDLSMGAVKIMLTLTTGSLQPIFEELLATVCRARDEGFQVAVHAVEREAVEAAVAALTYGAAGADTSASHSMMRDRIEHCSECPPDALRRLAGSGIVIVSQPGFLYYSGRRYLSEVAKDLQPWLYRFGSFMRAGIPLAAGSDAPVIEPNPLVGIYAAVTRRSDTGEVVGDGEAVSADEALRMYTINAAFAAFQEADRGSIEVGKLADLVLLDRDPTRVEAGLIAETKVTMTVVGGRIVWRS